VIKKYGPNIEPVCVGPDGVIEALVQKAVFRGLGLHILLEGESAAPYK
jgi:gamma-glutamyl-gamma-aminobutyrate hydrolase PuuD